MKEELEKILLSDNILESIYNNIDVLLKIIPELKYCIGFEHKNPHHHLDVWNHTMFALSMSKKDLDIRLSLLLHDIGKPFSYQIDGDIRHFCNHPVVSANMTKTILKRLGYNKEYIDKICYLVLNHDSRITKNEIIKNYDLEYKRFCIQICDSRSHNPIELDKRNRYINKIKKLFAEVKYQNNYKYCLKNKEKDV